MPPGQRIRNTIVVQPGQSIQAALDPDISPEFLADQAATNNAVVENTLIGNGANPDPGHPFGFAAADLTLISFEPSNCFEENIFTTFFSIFGFLPACP